MIKLSNKPMTEKEIDRLELFRGYTGIIVITCLMCFGGWR